METYRRDCSAGNVRGRHVRVQGARGPPGAAGGGRIDEGAGGRGSGGPAVLRRHTRHVGRRQGIGMFRAGGGLLSPDRPAGPWPARHELLAGAPFVPATIPDDPALAGDAVRAWIAATAGTGQVPFAIPIDEPHTPGARAKVRAVAEAARAAGSGPGKFLLAVTDERRAEYGDAVDLAISLRAHRGEWTY